MPEQVRRGARHSGRPELNCISNGGEAWNAVHERGRGLRRPGPAVDAGFGAPIMYGSDVLLDSYGARIDAILDAPFLTEEQKRDILHDDAVEFLRLTDGGDDGGDP